MLQLFASIFMHSGGSPVAIWTFMLLMLVTGVGILVVICWVIVGDWIERTRIRTWPIVSGVVDIASVAFCNDTVLPGKSNPYDGYYRATLTYLYHYPEEQMGDYSRDFGNEDDAKAWANSYKGETVKVHVDPRDPTRSVLREEDL